MPTDTLKRFREESLRLGDERKKRQGEPLERMRAGAAAVIALVSETSLFRDRKHLEELLEEIRAAAEESRTATEASITAALTMAEEAIRIWETWWEAALSGPAKDRADKTALLRWVLEDAGQALQETLHWVQKTAPVFERPLARLDELKARAAEFPLWSRECLARWEMLDRPAPTLDPERVARAQAAYARGEHEDIGDVLSRVEAGGQWVKE